MSRSAAVCRPDIIHAHDWQSAPVVFGDMHPAKSVFTIHNMEFGVDQIGRAVAASAMATTVSPTYAVEVTSHAAFPEGIPNGFLWSVAQGCQTGTISGAIRTLRS